MEPSARTISRCPTVKGPAPLKVKLQVPVTPTRAATCGLRDKPSTPVRRELIPSEISEAATPAPNCASARAALRASLVDVVRRYTPAVPATITTTAITAPSEASTGQPRLLRLIPDSLTPGAM